MSSDPSRDAYTEELAYLQQTQRGDFPYTIELLGQPFTVHKATFSPKYFQFSTEVCAKQLPVRAGSAVLEIGTGIGVIAILAAQRGASRVVATDISTAAVNNARENVRLNGVADRVEVRLGDVFEPIGADEKFDTIFTELPYLYIDPEAALSMLERSLFDSGYAAYQKFITEGRNHLKPGGRLLFGFSKDFGDFAKLEAIAQAAGLRIHSIYQQRCDDDVITGVSYIVDIFEVVDAT